MYDWQWIITSRGDSGILGKQYVQTIQAEDMIAKQNHEENMLVSTFDSSIAADEVFAKITQLNIGQELVDVGEDIEKSEHRSFYVKLDGCRLKWDPYMFPA